MEPNDQQALPALSAEQTAETEAPSGLSEEAREPLPRAAGSDRILWLGAAVAVFAHILPFIYLREPNALGEGVLTEAIAVELVDNAVLEGKDQTPRARPAAAAPPSQPSPAAQAPPGPPQKPQQAIPPSPPPAPPVAAQAAPEPAEPEAAAPPKALPAFEGEDAAARPKAKAEQKDAKTSEKPAKPDPADPKQAAKPDSPAKPPQRPAPQRPPPQKQVAPQAPPAQQSAEAAPPFDMSLPGLAKSGEVSKFAKEVVAALAKAKPNAPGVKGNVTVTVVVAFGGGVRTAKVTGPSGNPDLDKLALDAAKTAKLPPPPADVSTDDLFYDVEYKFK